MSRTRSSKMRCTSRTWQAYSRGDQTPGSGRTPTPGPASTVVHEAAFSRIASDSPVAATSAATNPHSGQGVVRTQVQSLVSGSTGGNDMAVILSTAMRLRREAFCRPSVGFGHAEPTGHRAGPARDQDDLRPRGPRGHLDLRHRAAGARLLPGAAAPPRP